MTKQRLKEYRLLVLEESQLENELREHLDKSLAGGVVPDGLPRAGQTADPTAAYTVETARLYDKLVDKSVEVMRQRIEIEECISSLPPLERILMRERYIAGKDWEAVCRVIGYSWRQAHYLHAEIIKKIA